MSVFIRASGSCAGAGSSRSLVPSRSSSLLLSSPSALSPGSFQSATSSASSTWRKEVWFRGRDASTATGDQIYWSCHIDLIELYVSGWSHTTADLLFDLLGSSGSPAVPSAWDVSSPVGPLASSVLPGSLLVSLPLVLAVQLSLFSGAGFAFLEGVVSIEVLVTAR
ncbi:hypothetical protein F4775DRAFT_565509 [Biscogniauxia sp. FL1348]|nr:hypothetical protein F4775DRAFT_565509 [Biscogniauxia sp. FL1348]